jgi:hypothetical protein
MTTKDGPSFCWHCFRRLYTRPGGGWSYAEVLSKPTGLWHRVHHRCADQMQREDPDLKVRKP